MRSIKTSPMKLNLVAKLVRIDANGHYRGMFIAECHMPVMYCSGTPPLRRLNMHHYQGS